MRPSSSDISSEDSLRTRKNSQEFAGDTTRVLLVFANLKGINVKFLWSYCGCSRVLVLVRQPLHRTHAKVLSLTMDFRIPMARRRLVSLTLPSSGPTRSHTSPQEIGNDIGHRTDFAHESAGVSVHLSQYVPAHISVHHRC